ncbi:hypothetical protein HD554DRAFT_2035681 [Boletus coccyginus]|nr:hypothetical protein HD554DRAFT_2035681 [Boletus coccyginus]
MNRNEVGWEGIKIWHQMVARMGARVISYLLVVQALETHYQSTQLSNLNTVWMISEVFSGPFLISAPWVPSTILRRFEMEVSQISSWYDNYEGTPPPSQPWMSSTVLKRKIEEAPNRNPSEDEDLLKLSSEFGMEVDTTNIIMSDMRMRVTLTSQQTSVSVVHADDDAQLMAKKVKMEADDISLGKKTKALEHKSCSDYKYIDLPVIADQKWTSIFMDTVIL